MHRIAIALRRHLADLLEQELLGDDELLTKEINEMCDSDDDVEARDRTLEDIIEWLQSGMPYEDDGPDEEE